MTGTDTDAGKTTVVAALLRAFCLKGLPCRAIKPVQTGCTRNNGTLYVPDLFHYTDAVRCQANISPDIRALACFEPACSPHLASLKTGVRLEAEDLAAKARAEMADGRFTLIEGAGGIYAPLNGRQHILDLMLALGLPVLLVAPNRLGCISQALVAMRVLAETPLPAAGLVLCETSPADDGNRDLLPENSAYLARHAPEFGFPLLCELPFLPELASRDDRARRRGWQKLSEFLGPAADRLAALCSPEPEDIAADDAAFVWHPYAGAVPAPKTYEAVAAEGSRIRLSDGRSLIDGMSSWWCANLGYGRADLQLALARQARMLPHVMFGGFAHAPATRLAKKLLAIAPPGLGKVFFADSGSVAVEVALKMAIQYQLAAGNSRKTRLCALLGAYHGDTLGAMSVCDPVNGMHHVFAGYLPGQIFLDRPRARFGGEPDIEDLENMEKRLRAHSDELAAVIVEPIVQGAGGMWFYHPEYLKRLRELCAELGILLIADEIATGFGRTGRLFACEWAGISPDILCLGKALTGGMMSFSAVLASGRVAEAISSPKDDSVPGVLLHGPTFMANPLACSVALQAIETLLAFPWQENAARIGQRLAEGLEPCRNLPGVEDVRALGAIGVVETKKPVDTERMQAFFVESGVWIRPFSRLIYLMPPLVAANDEIDALCAAIRKACKRGLHL